MNKFLMRSKPTVFFGGGVNVALKHLRSYRDGACL